MITKVTHGRRVGGLLRYLYGPGRTNEHTRPHLVAGFDEADDLEPTVDDRGHHDVRRLATLLEGPLAAVTRGFDDPVWHCSMSAAPGERLTDAQWAEAARELMHQTGYARRDDPAGCRWVAIHHGLSANGNDHIHVVVTLARQDGRLPSRSNDYYAARRAAQTIERRFGLRVTANADRTAARRPTRAEQEKATRVGRREAPRATLRREVQLAAAGASSEGEFFDLLRSAGLLVRHRFSTINPGEITGYAVALDGDIARDGTPIFHSGGKLAADLTLPKLRHRWITPSAAGDAHQPRHPKTGERTARDPLSGETRDRLWRDAARTAAAAAARIRRDAVSDPDAAADAAHAAGDVLGVTARLVEGRTGGPLTTAADTFDRAGREIGGRAPARSDRGSGLRDIARMLSTVSVIGDRDTLRLLALMTQVAALADAVGVLRDAQHRAAQAAAARTSTLQLREVIKVLTPVPAMTPAGVTPHLGATARRHRPHPGQPHRGRHR